MAESEKKKFVPGEDLTLEEMENHPYTRWLREKRHLAVEPSYVGDGHHTFFGMKVAMPRSNVSFMVTRHHELYVVDFERRGERCGLASPLKDVRLFIGWAAIGDFGLECAIAKLKPIHRGNCLPLARLQESYEHLFHIDILGHDDHGLPWVGRSRKDFLDDPALETFRKECLQEN